MGSYFVKENREGGYVKSLNFDEIADALKKGEIKEDFLFIKADGRIFSEISDQANWVRVGEMLKSYKKTESPEGIVNPIVALKFFAWFYVIIGIIVAFYFFGKSDDKSGVIIGIAILLQGAFMCALFLVIAGIGEDLKAIRSSNANK